MKTLLLCCISFLLAFSLPAFATSPCRAMKESDFRKNVVQTSDVAVDGTITDFSTALAQNKWTKIKVGKVWKGRVAEPEIIVKDWQAYMLPMYSYNKGDRVLLLLKRAGNEYLLTDSDWNSCVPSITNITPDGKVCPFIIFSPPTKSPMAVDIFEHSLFMEAK